VQYEGLRQAERDLKHILLLLDNKNSKAIERLKTIGRYLNPPSEEEKEAKRAEVMRNIAAAQAAQTAQAEEPPPPPVRPPGQVICSQCSAVKAKTGFSSAQLKKKEARRCKLCVESTEARPAADDEASGEEESDGENEDEDGDEDDEEEDDERPVHKDPCC